MRRALIILALMLMSFNVWAAPGYEKKTKQELWEALVVCDARVTDRDLQYQGCMQKLATRTSSVVNKLVVPPPPEQKGHDTEWLIAIGAGGVLVGVILGFLFAGRNTGTTVVK